MRARSRRGSAFISGSEGSTNAPIGRIAKRRPRLSIFTFATLARIPCMNSWIPTAIARAKIPYPRGMIGLIPGIPSSISGLGARSGGMFWTRIASHTRRAVIPTIVRATRTMLRSPNMVHARRNREARSIPDLGGEIVVREDPGFFLRYGAHRELLDPVRAQDPVVDAPQLPLLDVDLLLARPQEARLLEHVEHVAVVHVEAVVDHLRVETEERDEVVREGHDVLLRHPAAADGEAQGGPEFRHRHDRHAVGVFNSRCGHENIPAIIPH